MIKPFIFCDYCETNITKTIEKGKDSIETSREYRQALYLQENMITINGRIHYCDEDCKKGMQGACALTDHNNSDKNQVEGECLDCGISYADPNL